MNLSKFKLSLVDSLVNSCEQSLTEFKRHVGDERIYSVAIYCSSGCTSMGVAAATEESLRRRNKSVHGNELASFINMMNASEWEYVNLYPEQFAATNRMIDDFYACLYEGEFDDHKFDDAISSDELGTFANDVFSDVVSQAILRLISRGVFMGKPFATDMLFGLQFGDPSRKGVAMIKEVSSKVNSPDWHAKVIRNCGYILNRAPTV